MKYPIIYINLNKDLHRRAKMESQFVQLKINVQRFSAIQWSDLDLDEQNEYYSSDLNECEYHIKLLNGEKGCYLSHYKVWQHLLASEYEAMVVLEDDINIGLNFSNSINLIEECNFKWDMIKLIGRDNEKILNKKAVSDEYNFISYKRVPSLTAGYVISRSGAEKLVKSRKPFGRPIDVDLRYWWENNLKIYGILPSCIELNDDSFNSSIGGRIPHSSLLFRWKKFKIKFAMTLKNYFKNMGRVDF